jgi:3-hydroxybutyryl-CoA dehydrogenase
MNDNTFTRVAIIGAGTMGHGIAQVSAMAGMEVTLFDLDARGLNAGLARVQANLDKGVDRGKVSEEARESTLTRISGTTDLRAAVSEAELVIEAVPEKMALKQALFSEVDAMTTDGCVYGTNTSSLSIARIAEAVANPSQMIGLHFFNPVHIMKLLEVVTHPGTADSVLNRIRAFGAEIGKTSIFVKDFPGFATSRLGVALGMEAIRMLEQGVASAEDIDAAMVLGYRHPVGPLKLTDMVGLDVRMNIGEYLAKELDNPAFNPPDLMRKMVAEGKLGKKSGNGFYRW